MPTLKVAAPLSKPGGTTISYVDGGGVMRIIFFDATLRDQHDGSAEVSFRPLDVNALVTDHVRASPRGLTIDAEVTNTPLIPYEGDGSVMAAIDVSSTSKVFSKFASVGGGTTIFAPGAGSVRVAPITFSPGETTDVQQATQLRTLQYPTAFDRVKEVWEALDTLRDTGTAVQIVTRLHTYEEMVLTNVSAPHEAADAIQFQISAVEIRRADSQVIQVDPPVGGEKRAQKKQDSANQPTYTPSVQREAVLRKGLVALADAAVQ